MSGPGRFLIVSWDGGGNTPPALNLGARLTRQGHQVRLLGWESMASRAAAAGVEFTAYPSVPPWPPELAFEDALEERLMPALDGPGPREDILTEATGFAPDVVVVDCMMGAGLKAAYMLGLPSAVLVHLPYSAFMYEWGDEAARAEKARFLNEARTVLALVPPGFARCRATRRTSARSLTRIPGSRSIRATPACWPSLVTRGCCSVSAPPCRGRLQHCRRCSTPLRRCRSGFC
jgi:UDP:flavonoid glycosyltransferase YjiC (YdhE family)